MRVMKRFLAVEPLDGGFYALEFSDVSHESASEFIDYYNENWGCGDAYVCGEITETWVHPQPQEDG